MLRKIGVLVASLVLVLVSSLAMVLVPATQAAAGDVPNTVLTGGGPATGNSPPGTPSTGGPGNNYTPPPTDDQWETYSDQMSMDSLCTVKPDGRKPISYTAHYVHITAEEASHSTENVHQLGSQWYRWASTGCNYGGLPKDSPAECAWTVTVEGFGPNESPDFFPKQEKKSDFYNSDHTSADLCDNTVRLNSSKRITEMGRYHMDTVLTTINCVRTDFPGSPQASVIKDCDKLNLKPSENKVSQWCGGSETNWDIPHSFTMDECAGLTGLEVQCVEPLTKLWSVPGDGPQGVLSKATYGVLDDGKHHTALWGEPTLSGDPYPGGAITKLSTTMTVQRDADHSSTPFREGFLQESGRQPYQGVPRLGPNDGILNTLDLQWYAPSMPGRAWVLERVLTVRANFTIMMTQYDYIDQTTDTAHWATSKVATPVSSTKECTSELRVTVKRARNIR